MLGYLDVLRELHCTLQPAVYLEIGVYRGDSLRLAAADTTIIGVDPEPDLTADDPLLPHVVVATSDDFFAGDLPGQLTGGRSVDLSFIDGMHLFEFALRDFAQTEALSAPDSVIVLHDVLPRDALTASRERTTDFWTGDVWKLTLCLLDHRPDLSLHILDVAPSGVCLVRGFSPERRAFRDGLEDLTAAYKNLTFDEWERRSDEVLSRTTDNVESRAWACRRAESDAREEAARLEAEGFRDQLREAEATREALTARLEAVSEHLAVTQEQLDAERTSYAELVESARRQADVIDRLNHEMKTVAASWSWRLTTPVRSLASALKRLQRS